MPGHEAEAAVLVESYLAAQRERAEEAARGHPLRIAYLCGSCARGWALK
jgi:hypothetical protein